MRQALVLGGTGVVGREVVRELTRAGARTVFCYRHQAERAAALAAELGCRAEAVDAADATALRGLIRRLGEEGFEPDVFVHCAARLDAASLDALSDEVFDAAYALNARSAFVACRELGRAMSARGAGDLVLVGGLDRAQSLPVPVAYAATQGMLAAMTMALAKELGPRGVRINMVALGLLDAGLSLGLDPKIRADYLTYSALRRFGSAAEVARTIAWLALENRYVSGKVVAVNGGL